MVVDGGGPSQKLHALLIVVVARESERIDAFFWPDAKLSSAVRMSTHKLYGRNTENANTYLIKRQRGFETPLCLFLVWPTTTSSQCYISGSIFSAICF